MAKLTAALRLVLRDFPAAFHAAITDDTAHLLTADLGEGMRAVLIWTDDTGKYLGDVPVFVVDTAILHGDQTVREALRKLVDLALAEQRHEPISVAA